MRRQLTAKAWTSCGLGVAHWSLARASGARAGLTLAAITSVRVRKRAHGARLRQIAQYAAISVAGNGRLNKTLQHIATMPPQPIGLLQGFHPFGDHTHAKILRQTQERSNNHLTMRVQPNLLIKLRSILICSGRKR